MRRFLIEFRLHGYAKDYARDLMHEVGKKFRVGRATGTRAAPHVTLYGPSETNGTVTVRKVVSEVERIGRKYSLVPYRIRDFDCFDEENKRKVIYLDIEPSVPLQNLRSDLAQALRGISAPTEYDQEPDYEFHSTIVMLNDGAKFRRIWGFVKSKEAPDISQYVPRVTILGGNRRIICEYDLVLGRLLDRRQALSRRWWLRTITKMRELQKLPRLQKPSIRDRISLLIRELSGKKSVFFIGDTHFDHANIIRYCKRPFSDVREMNAFIRDSWNGTVGWNDTVYFLGDWSFGRGSRPAEYWMRQLRGRIIWVRGSHDRGISGTSLEEKSVLLRADGYDFLLLHDPKDRPSGWRGWTIHGHIHNNDMGVYPFINGEQRTINVSVELVNFRPLSLSHLLSLDLRSIRRMATVNDEPERPLSESR